MSRQWNERQRMAIDARGKSVVVSAAAGSGKTSVLTERVLRLIEEGEDIENMLIVTFTNLAASEMRERIYKRLQDAGAASPRLAAQAEKCAFADISTLHAFCGRLIRDNFEYAGTSPLFAIASEAETARLRQEAMEQAIEQAKADDSMRPVAEKYSGRGDTEQIAHIVSAIYNRAVSLKEPQQWLDEAYKHFDGGAFVDVLFEEFKGMVVAAAADAAAHLAQRSAVWTEKGFAEEADESETDRILLLRAAQAINRDFVILPEAGEISTKVKGAPNRESATLTNRANRCFDGLRGIAGDFAMKVNAELRQTARDGRFFIDLTRLFMKLYARGKRAKNLIDHDDTMHFALKALGVADVAARYRAKYAHVFVDEYQDINEAQHAIITSVQRDGNDFLVGDVKQCIYTFRESNPDLLIKRCRELQADGLIEMNTNYRSQPGVIRFINGVMAHMMTEGAGGVDYTGGQRLDPGAQGEGRVEIIIAHREDEENVEAEAREIGAQIRRLLDDGLNYGDIAVLRPEITQSGKHIAKALTDMNIPVAGGGGGTDEGTGELTVLKNALKLLQSETDDIAMLSVMRYPHFGFTEPELAQIRLSAPEAESFCAAVRAFGQPSALGDKVSAFRATMDTYRRLAACMTLPDFLMHLRLDLRLRDYALTSPGGAASEAAIGTFLSEAASLGVSSLADLLAVADRLGRTKETQQNPAGSDGVYLTTIHKSKGLEFRAVILSGLHKKIDQRDTYGSVLVGRGLGLALDDLDEATHIRKPTLHRLAVAQGLRREKISETVRLLYVGMTRAIERLIILGAGCEIKEAWSEPKAVLWQHSASTHFDLLMPAVAMMCRDEGIDLDSIVRIERDETAKQASEGKAERLAAFWQQAEAQQPEALYEAYAHQGDTGVPSKVSVSALKRMQDTEVFRPVVMPSADEGMDAAQRGTLMHRVMEHIGFEPLEEAQVRARIDDMAQKGLIDAAQTAQVDAAAVSRFLHSELARRAQAASMRRAEQPFCLRMSAREAGLSENSDECVVVQGVIDLCFMEDDQWVIVDYKTDRVSRVEAAKSAQKYAVQLNLYAKALQRITHTDVKEKHIYYLALGEAVKL